MLEDHLAVALLRQAPTPQPFAVQLFDSLGELIVLDEIPTEPALIQCDRLLVSVDLTTALNECERIPES
nr:hypothetical protein [Haloplanus aerogenes]